MQIHTYADASEFLRDSQPFLERDEVTSAVIFGIARRLAGKPPAKPYFFARIDDGRGPLLAAMLTPPFKLSLWSDREVAPAALDLLARTVLDGGWPIPAALGRPDIAAEWARRWSELTGAEWRRGKDERIYKLTAVTPPPATPGALRQAGPEDLDLVAGWAEGFGRDIGEELPPGEAREFAANRIAGGQIYLWEDGEPVSMAAWARPTLTGITVNLVYTPPERRGRGYAMAAVAELSQRQLDAGYAFCTLYTDLANPTSNSIYQKIGYRPVGDVDEYLFGAPPSGDPAPAEERA